MRRLSAVMALSALVAASGCSGSSSQPTSDGPHPADLVGATAVPTPSPGETLILVGVAGPLTKADLDATQEHCGSAPGVSRIVAGPGLIVIGTTSGGAAFDQVRDCARALPFVRSVD